MANFISIILYMQLNKSEQHNQQLQEQLEQSMSMFQEAMQAVNKKVEEITSAKEEENQDLQQQVKQLQELVSCHAQSCDFVTICLCTGDGRALGGEEGGGGDDRKGARHRRLGSGEGSQLQRLASGC